MYGYDAAGNRTSQTDARGVTVGYQYDALNRLTLVDYPGSALDQSFSHDAGSGQAGRLTGIVDASGVTSLGYDAFGNLTSETRVIDGVSYLTAYGVLTPEVLEIRLKTVARPLVSGRTEYSTSAKP